MRQWIAGLLAISLMLYGCSGQEVARAPDFVGAQDAMGGKAGALSSAWADFNNDGNLDLVIAYKSGLVEIYRNDGDRFTEAGSELGLPRQGGEGRGLAWGDYNQDGYVDLYVGTRRGGNALYRNNAGRGFTNVAAELGLVLPEVNTRQVSWIDYNNSGRLDLFIANRSGANYLFRNEGGRFVDVTADVGLADTRPAVGGCWFDYDGDGHLDLFIAHQNGESDALYRNTGGRFRDVAEQAGLSQSRSAHEGGVGCAVADFDNDGQLDIFVATYGEDLLYRNNGDGTFSQVAPAMGIVGHNQMVGASWGDYDNDGLIDLYVAGHRDDDGRHVPDCRLYHNRRGEFGAVPLGSTALNDADHGVQWADFNGNGALDLAITKGYDDPGRNLLLVNQVSGSGSRRSLQVLVLDGNGHHTRAGSELRLYDLSGDLLATRVVSSGDGYNSQSTQPVHFGLGEHQRVTLEIRFLTAEGPKMQRVKNISVADWAGAVLTVEQRHPG